MKRKKNKKKERPFALSESYFLLRWHENRKRNSFLYLALGAVASEYITYLLVSGK